MMSGQGPGDPDSSPKNVARSYHCHDKMDTITETLEDEAVTICGPDFKIGAPFTPGRSLPVLSSQDTLLSVEGDSSLLVLSPDGAAASSLLVLSPDGGFLHGHGRPLTGAPGAACPDACPVCQTPGCVAEESGERSSFVYHVGPKNERSLRVKKTLLLDAKDSTPVAPPPSMEGK